MLAFSSSHDCESHNMSKIKFNRMIEESNSLLSSPAGWDTLGYPLFGLYGHQKCQRTWLPTTGSPLAPSWLHSVWRQSADNQEKHAIWKSLWKLYKRRFLSSMMWFFYLVVRKKMQRWFFDFNPFSMGGNSQGRLLNSMSPALGKHTGNAKGIPGFLTNTVMSRCPWCQNMSFRVASLCLIHTMAKGSFKVFNDFGLKRLQKFKQC